MQRQGNLGTCCDVHDTPRISARQPWLCWSSCTILSISMSFNSSFWRGGSWNAYLSQMRVTRLIFISKWEARHARPWATHDLTPVCVILNHRLIFFVRLLKKILYNVKFTQKNSISVPPIKENLSGQNIPIGLCIVSDCYNVTRASNNGDWGSLGPNT